MTDGPRIAHQDGNPEVDPNICDKIGFNTWRDSISRSLFRLFAVLSSVILPLHRASEKKYFIMLENFYHAVTFRDAPVYKVMIMKVGAVLIVPKTLRTYIEAVPELETCIDTFLCDRRDQAGGVPWVPSIFALGTRSLDFHCLSWSSH